MENTIATGKLVLISLVFCTILIGSDCNTASAGDPAETVQGAKTNQAVEPEYHTPLAGEPAKLEAFGQAVDISERNRDNGSALVLGTIFFTPQLAEQVFLPLGAYYWKHRWDDTRF